MLSPGTLNYVKRTPCFINIDFSSKWEIQNSTIKYNGCVMILISHKIPAKNNLWPKLAHISNNSSNSNVLNN